MGGGRRRACPRARTAALWGPWRATSRWAFRRWWNLRSTRRWPAKPRWRKETNAGGARACPRRSLEVPMIRPVGWCDDRGRAEFRLHHLGDGDGGPLGARRLGGRGGVVITAGQAQADAQGRAARRAACSARDAGRHGHLVGLSGHPGSSSFRARAGGTGPRPLYRAGRHRLQAARSDSSSEPVPVSGRRCGPTCAWAGSGGARGSRASWAGEHVPDRPHPTRACG